jgi:hypothetical protein
MRASESAVALCAIAGLALGACQVREMDVTPPAPTAGADGSLDVAADASVGAPGDAPTEAPPPCFLGGSTTLAPANVACDQTATGRIVLDETHVYWTVQRTGDVLMRAPLGGGAPEVVARAAAGAVGLVLVGGYAYYTLPTLGLVMRVRLAGGLPQVVTSQVTYPVLVTSDGAALYVTAGVENKGTVSKVALAPGDAGPTAPVTLADGLAHPRGIVAAGGYVYWVDFTDGTLLRAADHLEEPPRGPVEAGVDGAAGRPSDGAAEGATADTTDAPSDGAARDAGDGVTDGTAHGAARDAADGVTDGPADGAARDAADGPADGAADGTAHGAAAPTISRLASGLTNPSDLTLRDGFVYLADRVGHLVRVPHGGGNPQTVVPDAHGVPYGVATDGLSLYWTTLGDGGVFKAPLAGGPVTTLVTGEADPHFLAVSAGAVYWGAWGGGGVIKRFAK